MIAVVDYGMGNLHSVEKGLEAVGADVMVTSNPDDLKNADAIVLPGVGSFAQGIEHLTELKFNDALRKEVVENKKPFLGICLGMQLIAKRGEEFGDNEGLGWIDAKVKRFELGSKELKVPHMGWNDVEFVNDSPLFRNLKSPTTFYFVHSYYFVPENDDVVAGRCQHGINFTAAVSKDNIHLVQFHPEKSQSKGLQILENFVDLI